MADREVQVSKANSKFAFDMYKILSKTSGNVIFSPLSAHATLSMCYQGAAGTTYDKFASTLHVPDKDLAAEGYSSIMDTLNSMAGVTLHIANRLYLKTGYQLQKEFESTITDKFQSAVESVNFANSQASATAINDWVKEKTRSKIQKLFEDDAFDNDTLLVLVNAIYFKGTWGSPFEKHLTSTQPFYVDENTTIDCQMMLHTTHFNMISDDFLKAQILELPYAGGNVSMFIILPHKNNGIAEVEAKLPSFDLDRVVSGPKRQVRVALPKFKIETTMELVDILTEMGLGEIFDSEKCNLSRMLTNSPRSYISRGIQKAFIEVNEEGSEAAAATGASVRMRRSLHVPDQFIADKPFMFSIIHKQNRAVLFLGKIIRPSYEVILHDEL